MEIILVKAIAGWANGNDEAEALHQKTKTGQAIHADFKQMRSYAFHMKYFALLKVAFDAWEPGPVTSKHGIPEKNFDRFRADVTILAGHYRVVIRLDGSTVIEPESISFGKMDQETFEKLYSSTIDVILKRIPQIAKDREDLDAIVDKVLSFA